MRVTTEKVVNFFLKKYIAEFATWKKILMAPMNI